MTKGKRELVLACLADLRDFFKDGREGTLMLTAAQAAKRFKDLTEAHSIVLCNKDYQSLGDHQDD